MHFHAKYERINRPPEVDEKYALLLYLDIFKAEIDEFLDIKETREFEVSAEICLWGKRSAMSLLNGGADMRVQMTFAYVRF